MSERKAELIDEFCGLVKKLAYRYECWNIWSDFLRMAAMTLANMVKTPEWDRREEEYLSIINSYSKEEQKVFPQLLGLLDTALAENPDQDFLGEVSMCLHLSQKDKGQYFTPCHVAKMMALLTYGDMKEKKMSAGYIEVNDPACGSGSLLIAFAEVAKSHGIDPEKEILFVAQDLNCTAAFMCYIQLALLGYPAFVIVGDVLTNPGLQPYNQVWYTPAFYLQADRFVEKQGAKPDECGYKTGLAQNGQISCYGESDELLSSCEELAS
ncbi:MAG: N-6 DNA methylase [Alitiscatomonas sp.]